MANYKATQEFTSKAGTFKKDELFKTDRTHGEDLVKQNLAEEVKEEDFKVPIHDTDHK